ncbi:hypothetical protein MPSEU_000529100 [Mayamaea pseudoterrestris]|nr:hypothetical protein MPSEU_000529100 [Mayamaea pseudoterrestris]
MLLFPDFNKPFDVHGDSQLGLVRHKEEDQSHSNERCSVLGIVEALKEYRNVLLGQEVRIHNSHGSFKQHQSNDAASIELHSKMEMVIERIRTNVLLHQRRRQQDCRRIESCTH